MSDIVGELIRRFELNEEDVRLEQESMRRQIRAYKLKELRKAKGVTQVEISRRLQVSQNRISRLERGDLDRMQIDTLRNYIEALGGTLHVEAHFDELKLVVQ